MIQTEDNYQQINAEAEEKDDDSILNFYKKLIALRKEMPVISEGKIQFLEEDKEEVMAYTRTTDNQKLAVFCNLKEEESEVEWEEEKAEKLIGNYPDEDDLDVQNGKLKLRETKKAESALPFCIPVDSIYY